MNIDHRHPTKSRIGTINEDSLRRDFSINSMYFSLSDNKLLDPSGHGFDDFKNHELKFIGDVEDRLSEDMLRGLRYTRFICRFDKKGFAPDRDELNKMINTYDHTVVSVERIYQELDAMFKILKEDNYSLNFVVATLDEMKIFKRFITDPIAHTMIINDIFTTFDYLPLLLAMRGDIQTLKLSSEYRLLHTLFITFEYGFEGKDFSDQALVKKLLQLTDGDYEVAERLLNRFNSFKCPNNHKEGLITLKALKNKADKGEEEPFKVTHLKVNGNDLMKLGFKGPEIGLHMNILLDFVVKRPEMNTRKKLMGIFSDQPIQDEDV